MSDYIIQTWNAGQSRWIERLTITTDDIGALFDQANTEQVALPNGTKWRIIEAVPVCADNIK